MTDFMDINDDPSLDLESSRRSLLNNNDNLDYLPNLLSDSGDEKISEKRYIKRQSTRRKSLRKSQRVRNNQKDYLKLFIPGVVAMLLGIIIYAIDPFNLVKDLLFSLEDGTLIYNLWRLPPIKLYIKIYVFNVTNGDRFLKGSDPKLKVKEVGPYVYSDQLSHNDVLFYQNNTLSFIGKHNLTFEPSLSTGDTFKDTVVVTNVALLGIASKLFNAPIALRFGLTSAISYTNPPPILNMTVQEYLWGYEEPLVKYGSKVLPSWLNFGEKVGILERMFDEGNNRITIAGGKDNRFKAEKMNGSPGLQDWGYTPDKDWGKCGLINGTYDGILFSPNPPERLMIYRKLFCRPFPIRCTSENGLSSSGVRVKEYTIAEDAFNNSLMENKCYCYDKAGCFPTGVGDMSPCYFGIPVGLSSPHFYGASSSLYSKIEGLTPDAKKHSVHVQIQPDLGIPLYGRIPVQLNVLVRKVRFVSRVRPFSDMVVPLFWVEVLLEGLPHYLDSLIWFLMKVVPQIQTVSIITLIVGGLLLVFAANIRYLLNSKPWDFSTRKRASIISHRIKQETRRLSTRSQHFIPLTNMDEPKGRL